MVRDNTFFFFEYTLPIPRNVVRRQQMLQTIHQPLQQYLDLQRLVVNFLGNRIVVQCMTSKDGGMSSACQSGIAGFVVVQLSRKQVVLVFGIIGVGCYRRVARRCFNVISSEMLTFLPNSLFALFQKFCYLNFTDCYTISLLVFYFNYENIFSRIQLS